MKKPLTIALALIIALSLLPACDVMEALTAPSSVPSKASASPQAEAPGFTDDTVVVFSSKRAEDLFRAILGIEEGDVTAGDMGKIKKFNYTIDITSRMMPTVVTTLSDLRYCANLEELNVGGQTITDIEGLRGLKKLRSVSIHSCHVSDLSPLAGKEALLYVDICETPVADASAVLSLENLVSFSAWLTDIKDISALKGSASLRSFECDNVLDDYSPLCGLTTLSSVRLKGMPDAEFRTMLENNRGLTSVWLTDSKLKDDSLHSLIGLRLWQLCLMHCGIRDISALSNITTLENLSLEENGIEDISPLSGLTQLKDLGLFGNEVTDFSPLKNLKKLKSLGVWGNPGAEGNQDVFEALAKNSCAVYK